MIVILLLVFIWGYSDNLAIDYDEVDVKLKFLLAMVERGRIPKVGIDDAL